MSRTSGLTETDRYYLDAARGLGVPEGGAISAAMLAEAAGCYRTTAGAAIRRLQGLEAWPWRRTRRWLKGTPARVLAIAAECGGHVPSIARRLGLDPSSVRRVRRRIIKRDPSAWPWRVKSGPRPIDSLAPARAAAVIARQKIANRFHYSG